MTGETAGIRADANAGIGLGVAILAACTMLMSAPAVHAQPPAVPAPPPPSPGPPAPPQGPMIPLIGAPLGPAGFNVLAQSGPPTPVGPLGVPQVPGVDKTTVLGQNAVPSAPGTAPGIPPDLRAFNNGYGVPQNQIPSAPGVGSQFDVVQGQQNADVSGREWLGRYIDLYRDGRLRGALLGQLPREQLGQPLPGTAPPPDASVPPGLVQFLPVPNPESPTP